MQVVIGVIVFLIVASDNAQLVSAQACTDKEFIYLPQMTKSCSYMPNEWKSIHSNCEDKAANRQSPIQLDVRQCQASTKLQNLRFSNEFTREADFIVLNNGHSLNFQPSIKYLVSGGNLIGNYKVSSLHLHWGNGISTGRLGSEHRYVNSNGNEHPTSMELHVVLMKDGLSDNQNLQTKENVAVIGIMFQSNEVMRFDNRKDIDKIMIIDSLSRMGSKIQNIKTPCDHHAGAKCATETIKLRLIDLIPRDAPLKYINYDGSLTTPGCNPVVQWHMIHPPVSINQQLISQFTQIKYHGNYMMINNYRPLQQLHGRKISCYGN